MKSPLTCASLLAARFPRPARRPEDRAGARPRRVAARGLALACLVALLAAGAGRSGPAAMPPAVAKGEIVVATTEPQGDDAPTFTAHALVDAPPAVVWSVVSRCSDYKKNMPRIAASEELKREGSAVVCKVTADMPFPLSDLTSVSRAVHTEDAASGRFRREWKFIEGDYHINEGAWILEPIDGGRKTYAVYRLKVKPKLPVPSSLAAMFQKGPLVDVMTAVRKEAKKRLAAAPAK